MRLLNICFGRITSNVESLIPIEAQSNMKLRDRVSGKGTKVRSKGCMWEFSLLTNCLSQNMHDERMCKEEVSRYSKCYENSLAERRLRQKMTKTESITPGSKNYNLPQLNNYLKQFPQQ